jgi:tetratricopeptide (TPR) repeat protein
LALYRTALGTEHRQVAITLGQLGTTLANRGKVDEGERLLREGIAMAERILGETHPHVVEPKRTLAEVLARQGRRDEARRLREEAITAEDEQLTQYIELNPQDFASVRRRAEDLAELGRTDDAMSDFARAIALQPQRPSLLAARADALARSGRCREALADLSHALEMDPDEHFRWYVAACLSAYLGDATDYRPRCEAMLRRFGPTARQEIADRTAKACLLLPGAVEPTEAVSLADRAMAPPVPAQFRPWFRMTKGIAEYRAGRFAEAIEYLTAGREGMDPHRDAENFETGTATADLFLAMAHYRLGHADDARAALRRAAGRIDSNVPSAGRDYIGGALENWLICQTIRREAEEIIGNGDRRPEGMTLGCGPANR